MKCGDEGEGSAGTGRFEHQFPGCGQHRGVTAGREKDRSVTMIEQQRGNTQYRVKPKCIEPQKNFPFFQPVLPACYRIAPGTELCLALSVWLHLCK